MPRQQRKRLGGIDMIAFLKGKLAAVEPESIVIDVGGVGYRVNVTAGCAAGLRGYEEVQLHTHMIVREDDMQLYGFITPGEITAFLLLLGVNGVGPKAALAVLSALTPRGLGRALAMEDTGALTRVSGVGKKIAQRIILELKDKLGRFETDPETTVTNEDGMNGIPDDAVNALMALGYSAGEAKEVVSKVFSQGCTQDVQQLIRSALRFLDQRK
ncbi:MAG TPA: Holliday junction branch migration protein RuvA [Desulfotomaculum sp.]|nr:Holliday junction branch migration protein RuvA [Desulfotomaculum sp.]